jgi:hypothetical protein
MSEALRVVSYAGKLVSILHACATLTLLQDPFAFNAQLSRQLKDYLRVTLVQLHSLRDVAARSEEPCSIQKVWTERYLLLPLHW